MQFKCFLTLVKRFFMLAIVVGNGAFFFSCDSDDEITPQGGYVEKEPTTIQFTNCSVEYIGDDIGEEISDAWLVKFYTDMSITDTGLLEGPGCVMQLLLNVKFDAGQTPQIENLLGEYRAQSNNGDFSANTFMYGYMNYIDLPGGRIERADGTFYGEVAEGKTDAEMEVDLLDDGKLDIIDNGDGIYTIEGVLAGKKCLKRYFTWSGKIEPSSRVEPTVENSTIDSDIVLNNLSHGVMEDRGDCFFLQDNSYRDFLIFLADDGVDLTSGRPQGSGDVIRLDLLVPWDANIDNGIPAGEYPMIVRNADTSINKENIVPFRCVAGLPDSFSPPYWSGAWYINYSNSKWSNRYALISSGRVVVERGEDGSHHIVCEFHDCATSSHAITCDITLAADKMMIKKYY